MLSNNYLSIPSFYYICCQLRQRANTYKTALTSSCIWLLLGKNVTNFDVNFLDSDVREIRALLSRRQSNEKKIKQILVNKLTNYYHACNYQTLYICGMVYFVYFGENMNQFQMEKLMRANMGICGKICKKNGTK